MKDNFFSFEDLKVYQKALLYIDWVYKTTEVFPKKEIYALSNQFVRASQSIALNIAEGSGGTTQEFINFLRIARRSVNECVVCTTIGFQQKYLSENLNNDSRNKLIELSKMINGLINSLK